ncbi:MAG: coproporphyrinogen III oxidase, partial [bacterium]|nr:coproporphyrinogen III oxidase [bacterium]
MNKQIKFQQEITDLFKEMQKEIVQTVLFSDPNASFKEDLWNRETEETTEAGGGITKTITNGTVFEKAGVNFSEVYGPISKELTEILPGAKVGTEFYATGTSVVLHPYSPKVPTVHCNFRYMNAGEFSWFGGGMDLTPYVLSEDDFRYFHQILKNTCDKHDLSYYPKFKKSCDEYFYLAHRKETRGIGGIFFDYLGKDQPTKLPNLFSFIS